MSKTKAARPGGRRLGGRVRVLPLTILAIALLLGLKIGAFWQGRSELFVTPAGAQQTGQQQAGQQQAATGRPMQLTPQQSSPTGNNPPAAPQMAQANQPVAPQGGSQAAPPAAAPSTQETQTPAPSSAVQSLASRDPTTFTRAEIELLANLAKRREQLEQRAREIDLRESLLRAAEQRIDERIAALKKLEASIKQIVQQYDQQEEKNLQGLVKVYENMKPKDAARIFEKLEPNVLLGVAERMKEAKLAAVLSDMTPAAAQDITVRLANRKLIPPSLRAGTEAQMQPAAPQNATGGEAKTGSAAPAPAANNARTGTTTTAPAAAKGG